MRDDRRQVHRAAFGRECFARALADKFTLEVG
jgi:hypothetical protein